MSTVRVVLNPSVDGVMLERFAIERSFTDVNVLSPTLDLPDTDSVEVGFEDGLAAWDIVCAHANNALKVGLQGDSPTANGSPVLQPYGFLFYGTPSGATGGPPSVQATAIPCTVDVVLGTPAVDLS